MVKAAKPAVLITGIAEGLGVGIAKAFAAEGHDVLGLSRSGRVTRELDRVVGRGGGHYTHLSCDIRDPSAVASVLQPHAGRIVVAVHNAHRLAIKPGTETTLDEFEEHWRVACFGAMAVAREVLPAMIARGRGTMIFTGATAGRRGGAQFVAFASAKFALRGLAQSLARECGPKGVHVAHVVLDGLIEEPQTAKRFGAGGATRIDPDAAARIYVDIARQDRSAWTHELDLRPFSERF